MICAEPGCTKRVHALGLCREHHKQYQAEMDELVERIERLEKVVAELKQRTSVPA